MKKILFLFIFLFISFFLFCDQAEFINQLLEKQKATFEDCVLSFNYLKGLDVSGDFESNLTSLKKYVPKMPRHYSKDKELTLGDFSLIAAQYLSLKSGLFYIASKSPRYAVRELTQVNILPFNTSEWDKLSGLNLIRLMQRIYTYVEEKK